MKERSIWKYTSIGALMVLIALLAMVPANAASDEEINQSIENGVLWLVAQQNATDGSWGLPDQSQIAKTGFAVVKLSERAGEKGYQPLDESYEYSDEIKKGLDFIFSEVTVETIDGVNVANWGPRLIYETSIAMMAIASSKAPGEIVNVPGSPVNGLTYKEVVQLGLNYLEKTQKTDGGWRYSLSNPLEESDNSNTGYAVLGLTYAQKFGITIPTAIIDPGLKNFVAVIQDVDGSSKYTPTWSWPNILKTGNLLYEMKMLGIADTDSRVLNAIGYIQNTWTENNQDPGWRGNYQAMYTLMKGFEAYNITNITVAGSGVDWFDEVSTYVVNTQNPDGSWPSDTWGDSLLTTEWALLFLEKVVPNWHQECILTVDKVATLAVPTPIDASSWNTIQPISEIGAKEPFYYVVKVTNAGGEDCAFNWVKVIDKCPIEVTNITVLSPENHIKEGDVISVNFDSIGPGESKFIVISVVSPEIAPTTLYNRVYIEAPLIGDGIMPSAVSVVYVKLDSYSRLDAMSSFESLLRDQAVLLSSFEDLLYTEPSPNSSQENYEFIASFEQLLRTQNILFDRFDDLMLNDEGVGWRSDLMAEDQVKFLRSYEDLLRREKLLFASFEGKLHRSWCILDGFKARGHTDYARYEFLASFEDLLHRQAQLLKHFEILEKTLTTEDNANGTNTSFVSHTDQIEFLDSFEDLLRLNTNLVMSFSSLLNDLDARCPNRAFNATPISPADYTTQLDIFALKGLEYHTRAEA